MLQTWTMADTGDHRNRRAGWLTVASDGDSPLSVLDEAGYTATLATNSEFEIIRYLRLGDVISAETLFESISAEKYHTHGSEVASSPG